MVAPRLLGDSTLASFDIAGHPYRFSVCDRQSGRAPELEDPATLEWLGRFIGRIHAVGAVAPFKHRLTLDAVSYGEGPRDWLMASGMIAVEAQTAWKQTVDEVIGEVKRCFDAAGAYSPIACTATPHRQCVVTDAGPIFLTSTTRSGPLQDLGMLLSVTAAAAACCPLSGYKLRTSIGASCAWSKPCGAAHVTTAPDRALGRRRPSRQLSVVRRPRTGASRSPACTNSSNRCGSRRSAGSRPELQPASSALTRFT